MLHRMGWQETPYQSARKQASVPIMLPLIPFREPEGFDIVALHFGATERNEWCLLLLISFNEDNGATSAIRIASESIEWPELIVGIFWSSEVESRFVDKTCCFYKMPFIFSK